MQSKQAPSSHKSRFFRLPHVEITFQYGIFPSPLFSAWMCIFFSAVCFSFAAVKQMPVQKLHVFFSPSVPLAPAVPYTPHAAMEQATASPKSTRQPLSSVPLPPVALTISRGDGTGNRQPKKYPPASLVRPSPSCRSYDLTRRRNRQPPVDQNRFLGYSML